MCARDTARALGACTLFCVLGILGELLEPARTLFCVLGILGGLLEPASTLFCVLKILGEFLELLLNPTVVRTRRLDGQAGSRAVER